MEQRERKENERTRAAEDKTTREDSEEDEWRLHQRAKKRKKSGPISDERSCHRIES